MHARSTVLMTLQQPRHATPAVADVMASHKGLRGSVLLIEGVRVHASAIRTGAMAVFRAFQPGAPAAGGAAYVQLSGARSREQVSFACSQYA
eukprot:COSAG02_NODE_26416_length_633_cov_1.513109_1_plen_92_part_00